MKNDWIESYTRVVWPGNMGKMQNTQEIAGGEKENAVVWENENPIITSCF